MNLNQLPISEYPVFFKTYIQALEDINLIETLETSLHDLIHFVQNVPMDKFDYRYQPEKWTIKDILQHIIDAERVFCYRALAIARKDKTNLPSFDEDIYANNTNANQRSVQDLLSEFSALRYATLALFKSFNAEALEQIGTVNNNPVSCRAIGFIIIGHQTHHIKIFKERYL